mmetsp:Transcript_54327/g.97949  ORF Transcript_54327/g.97949 Transcript_54327/m.97949 type:complete len:229 (-) Transcript_54327:194-880(-)
MMRKDLMECPWCSDEPPRICAWAGSDLSCSSVVGGSRWSQIQVSGLPPSAWSLGVSQVITTSRRRPPVPSVPPTGLQKIMIWETNVPGSKKTKNGEAARLFAALLAKASTVDSASPASSWVPFGELGTPRLRCVAFVVRPVLLLLPSTSAEHAGLGRQGLWIAALVIRILGEEELRKPAWAKYSGKSSSSPFPGDQGVLSAEAYSDEVATSPEVPVAATAARATKTAT